MLSPAQIAAAAEAIAPARLTRLPLDTLPADCRPADEAEGYAVQSAVHDRLSAAGYGAVVGHKIGCTTTVMQQYLEIANPCAGGVLASSVHYLEGTFAQSDMQRIGMECELAVVLGDDLDVPPARITRERVAQAIESLAVAIEAVEDRYVDYASLGTPTLIADDFFGAGCVLGPPVTAWHALELASVTAAMTINGELVGRGRGADILGDPLEALRWLAAARAARGRPLRAGEFVLLGSLVQTHWTGAGDVVRVDSPELGSAAARIV